MTISNGERWKVEMRMAITPQELALIGETAETESRLEALKSDPDFSRDKLYLVQETG